MPLQESSPAITVTVATDTTLTPGATAPHPTVVTLTGASLKPCYNPGGGTPCLGRSHLQPASARPCAPGVQRSACSVLSLLLLYSRYRS